MRFGLLIFVLPMLFVGSSAFSQDLDLSEFDLAPGERIVSVDGVPVEHYQPPKPRGGINPHRETSVARNIIGRLLRTGRPFSYTPGDTALEKANYERRAQGYGPLLPDPELQALALRKAKIAADRGIKQHVGGSLGSAKAEGVGFTNGRFLSCCLDEPATYGGAAMVQGRDGWYCCLLVR